MLKALDATFWWPKLELAEHKIYLQQKRRLFAQSLLEDRWAKEREAIEQLANLKAQAWRWDNGIVRIGEEGCWTEDEMQRLSAALRVFCPWKKGPFAFGSLHIDAEWRSDWKWQRLQQAVGDLSGHSVADIGCHNGYYFYPMLAKGAATILGFEPFAKHQLLFQLIEQLSPQEGLAHEPFGVEDIDRFPAFFDSVFCLGILYHHTDPIGLLRKIKVAMRAKAQLIIDCQGIPGDDAVALCPQSRYTGASGFWFLPTASCLENWVKRAGFSRIEWIFREPLSTEEQRRTAWADIPSLAEALDPMDPQKTKEGYPAPWRFYLKAQV